MSITLLNLFYLVAAGIAASIFAIILLALQLIKKTWLRFPAHNKNKTDTLTSLEIGRA